MGQLQADTQFGVSSSASDNTAAIQNAINAACNEGTQVIFPAGDLKFNGLITQPAGFQGTFSFGGLSKKVTRFVPVGGGGFAFDLSAGKAANNSVDIFDCGFVANAGNAGTAISITYGNSTLGSVEDQPGSSIRNVAIYGGGWTTGLAMINCWHSDVDGLYLCGGSNNYTTNNGVGLALTSCFNSTFNRLTSEFFTKGVAIRALPYAGSDSQGIFFDNIQMVECIEGIHAYGTAGGFLSTILIDNWMIDNGNLNVPGHRSIILDNAEDCLIGQGQGLQNGGDSQIIFNSCKNCQISPMVSLENRANTTGPSIQDNNGNNNSLGISNNSYWPSKLINISTRGFVGVGANVMIVGFVVAGTAPKTVLIRASGPALSQFGISNFLPDPKLSLTSAAGTAISSNTVWGGSSQIASTASQVGAFAWATTSKDSAILITLQPGNYTAQVSGATGDTGDALVEVYDVS